MKEVWKDIKGFKGYYQVSNIGRVRSLDREVFYKKDRTKKLKGRLLSINKANKFGYSTVCLQKKGIQSGRFVHRLVATAFIPNRYNKPQVNHINGIKDDNEEGNLEWCTAKENSEHAIKMKLKKNHNRPDVRGDRNHNNTLCPHEAMEVYELSLLGILTLKEISLLYGVSISTVFSIKRKRSWKHLHV